LIPKGLVVQNKQARINVISQSNVFKNGVILLSVDSRANTQDLS
jgi:hypothetical protein